MTPRKVKHIAFVSLEALLWPAFPVKGPALRTFVRLPRGYAHGKFTFTWLEPENEYCVIRFQVWRRHRRVTDSMESP